jgi:hypothetical protein
MTRAIQQLPWYLSVIGYALMAIGLIEIVGFIFRYMTNFHGRTEEGKHLIAMSANLGAFFLVHLVQLVWPALPGRPYILLGLLIYLVVNCGRRWQLLERHLRERKNHDDMRP